MVIADVFDTRSPTAWADAAAFLADQPDGTACERALASGLRADRVAYAFLGGYHAACDALMGPAPTPAMCVTETGPPHPRHIECRWSDGVVTGTKTYVTGGPLAQTLHVLCAADGAGDQRRLVVATVPAAADGVEVESLPPTSFVPEVPHGRVRFTNARPTTVVEDGWSAYVKPFRTVEDIHVNLAVAVYAARALHRHGGPAEDIDSLCAVVHALCDLSARSPKDPGNHRALAGVFALSSPIWERLTLPGEEGERWLRDRRLLRIAQSARDARRDAARAATSDGR